MRAIEACHQLAQFYQFMIPETLTEAYAFRNQMKVSRDDLGWIVSSFYLCHLALEGGALELAQQNLLEAETLFLKKIKMTANNRQPLVTVKMMSFIFKELKKKLKKPESLRYPPSALELKLVRLLNQGPKNKYELCDLLFKEITDLTKSENRLKNLIFRLRKKKFSIIFENSKYQLR